MRLGLVTYNLAKDWDLETILRNCEETRFEGVELRTTHAHGVEVSLSASQRAEVKARFADSPVDLVGLGSAFEFHSPDAGKLRANIEGTKEYVILARDVGAPGVKVRPNALPEGISEEQTLEQIGRALRECAAFAADHGVELRLEVHGRDTCQVPRIRTIIEHADHPNAKVCWNCNPQDLDGPGFDTNFDSVASKIALVHMRDLYEEEYPWRKLFQRLRAIDYDGFCLAEIAESSDPLRVMPYYRALFLALQE
jgi:sugar phosphate isomerase/epimerase